MVIEPVLNIQLFYVLINKSDFLVKKQNYFDLNSFSSIQNRFDRLINRPYKFLQFKVLTKKKIENLNPKSLIFKLFVYDDDDVVFLLALLLISTSNVMRRRLIVYVLEEAIRMRHIVGTQSVGPTACLINDSGYSEYHKTAKLHVIVKQNDRPTYYVVTLSHGKRTKNKINKKLSFLLV